MWVFLGVFLVLNRVLGLGNWPCEVQPTKEKNMFFRMIHIKDSLLSMGKVLVFGFPGCDYSL